MLNRRQIRQLYITLLCLAALWTLLPQSAGAFSRIDTERPVSLTLRCQKDNKTFSGAEFSLYRVADVSATARFTLTGDFQAYPVSLDQPDSAGWRALAETLAAYAARDGLTPLDSGKTGSDGVLKFPTDEQRTMLPGLYLVTGRPCVSGSYTYTPSPFLVSLPNLDRETDQWVYDESVEPKYTRENHGGGDSGGEGSNDTTVNRKVLKVWDDDGYETQRPEQIVVQLLRNGKVYRTAALNAENNWRYTWYNLDAGYDWQLVEETVPEGYTVSVSQDGITFVVTNTCQPDSPDNPDNPDNPDQPENPGSPDSPDVPEGPASKPPTTPDGPKPSLPQTGALWWPVPVLAGSGMLLFTLGWVRAQKRGREDEQ